MGAGSGTDHANFHSIGKPLFYRCDSPADLALCNDTFSLCETASSKSVDWLIFYRCLRNFCLLHLFHLGAKICAGGAGSDNCHEQSGIHDDFWVLLGMVIAISGPLIAISKGHPFEMLDALGFGQFLLICALFCWVSYTLLARKVLFGIDSLTATTISSVFGFILLLIAALCVENVEDWNSLLSLSQSTWMSLIGLSLGSTVLAYAWYFDGVKHLGAGNASAYIILIPIFGIIFSAIWLNEQVDSSLFIGGTLAVAGLAIMNRGRSLIK